MKIISLNESQFDRIFENIETLGNGENQIPDFQSQDETTITSKITDINGDKKNSKSPTADKFADMQTPQQWGSIGGRKSSNTI